MAAVILTTLGIGIGANTAIFSVVHGVLLQPLPYDDPEKLVLIRADVEGMEAVASLSPPELRDLQEQSQLFRAAGGIWSSAATLTGENPERVFHAWATENLFSLLGTDPILGRHFLPEEEAPNGPNVIILSYGLWQRRYGGEPDIIGKMVQLDDTDRTVVGVMPEGFRILLGGDTGVPPRIDVFIPQNFWVQRNLRWLRVIGRLQPGVTIAQAQGEMDAVAGRLVEEYQEYATTGLKFHVVPLHGDLVRDVRPGALALLGAVGFVLLIACSNVANLSLARTKLREQEIALRLALGAGRGRVLRQILTENLVLAVLGGLFGLLIASWGLDALLAYRPANLPRLDDISIDGTVLGFTTAVALLTGVLFGMAPSLRASRLNVSEALKEGGRTTDTARSAAGSGFRTVLVISQVALSLVLLIGAGLMIRTFAGLKQVDPGFHSQNVLTFQVPISFQKYSTPDSRWGFYRQLTEAVRALPGVQSTGAISMLPLSGRFFTSSYAYDPDTERSWGTLPADYRVILPGYFETMGTKLVAGRLFSELDSQPGRTLVIVDESLARRAWPGQDAVHKKLKVQFLGSDSPEWVEVIGVVRHIRNDELDEDGRAQIYFPYQGQNVNDMAMTVRTETNPLALIPAIRREVETLDSGRSVHTFRTMNEYVSDAMAGTSFVLTLFGLFAAVALLLASVGIYGVVSYSVSQRTHEIGIRMALGAHRHDIFRMVLGRGMVFILVGIVLGLAGAWALTRFLASQLYGVGATDPTTFAGTAVVLAAVALLACYLPSRRATRVDPMVVLRYE
jgi:putative ABC transport system permease protein